MLTTTSDIIAENAQRLAANAAPYDPVTGTEYEGGVRRVPLRLPDAPLSVQYIPEAMLGEDIVAALRHAGSLGKCARQVFGGAATEKRKVALWLSFIQARCKHDVEFWCATQISIVHKTLSTIIPFVLNRAQRYYLGKLEHLRLAGQPIDIILLKARQWGGSTLTQFYMFWIQMFWRKNWNSVICADVDDQAKGVMGMLERATELYDTFITEGQPVRLKPYMRTDSIRVITGRGCTISVGSAQHPEKLRSQNISMAHLTEVGVWKETKGKKPEDLIQSIFGSIVSAPYTLKVLESTAKGVGNYFHRTWLAAVKGDNNFTPVFVPWYMIDIYSEPIDDYEAFILSLTPYEQMLFDKGATLEAIAWYRGKLREMGEHWRMCSEYPTTPEEAFQSTGHNFYPAEYVAELRKGCTDPTLTGEIAGDEPKGEGALRGLRLEPQSNGRLKVWLDADRSVKMRDRYLVVVDIGGRSDASDNSVICVFDRYWMHEAGGVPEVTAEWCGHIEHDLLAWKAAQVASYYDNALLVVESNTLETKGSEGNHFNTLLSEIAEVYPNLYRRTREEQLVKGGMVRYGFHTNASTKPMVCDLELEVLRDGLYIERCAEAVDEHATFEVKENGELGAVEGCHDDRHITRAIGNYFNYKILPPPRFVDDTSPSTAGSRIVSEYSM